VLVDGHRLPDGISIEIEPLENLVPVFGRSARGGVLRHEQHDESDRTRGGPVPYEIAGAIPLGERWLPRRQGNIKDDTAKRVIDTTRVSTAGHVMNDDNGLERPSERALVQLRRHVDRERISALPEDRDARISAAEPADGESLEAPMPEFHQSTVVFRDDEGFGAARLTLENERTELFRENHDASVGKDIDALDVERQFGARERDFLDEVRIDGDGPAAGCRKGKREVPSVGVVADDQEVVSDPHEP
jgi:hypothetical protein